jgi:hypothetical protein
MEQRKLFLRNEKLWKVSDDPNDKVYRQERR